jgi:hypothetical protein
MKYPLGNLKLTFLDMKYLISTLFFCLLMICSLYAQQPQSVVNKVDQRSRSRAHKPALKSATKPILSSPATKSYTSNNVVYPEGQFKTSVHTEGGQKSNLIQYHKTGDPAQNAVNYQAAKQLYFDNHPELKIGKNQVQKISRSVYDNLPISRRAIIDAHAARYEIIE